MMTRKNLQKTVTIVIAVVVFSVSIWYLATTFQWQDIGQVLLSVKPVWLIVAAISILFYWLVRTCRWFILLRQLEVSISFLDLYMCSAVALGLAIITPFQSGEVLKVELLKKYRGMERFSGYSSFIVERMADLIVVFSMGSISLVLLPELGIDPRLAWWLFAAIMVSIVGALCLVWTLKLPGRVGEFQAHLRACVRDSKTLLIVMLLTLLGWAITALGWHLCLLSIEVDIGYLHVLMMTMTLTIIYLLSFVPGGVGVWEAGTALFLLKLGQMGHLAQAGALILRFYGFMLLSLAGGHLLVWKWFRRAEVR